ncbi:branched-chain amino acid ABC transporter permease [Bradyrhizobium canariense]|uniref:Amino acid/amide ABC transporter membrane protein 1, HAAT family n=1 Tax=Bradyrhizobium canariense TaxID=255045 RepID=A0A1H1SJ21_9BRAD|nr:branched-chain amino acid ABC transporter permease [Bradyrhizobium canariense]SDS47808.1 amino acid/amide ABC transporter membrane protein 1, HAAT family [Bradyrhizobium canariense]
MLSQQLVNAAVLGSMYALIAVGFTLYFGVLNLINLAHGAIYMIGAFVALSAFRWGQKFELPLPVLLILVSIIAVVFSGLIGMIVEKIAVKPLRRAPPLVFLITSIAVYLVLEEMVLLFYPDGGNPQVFPDPFGQKTFAIGTTIVGYVQVFLVSVAVLSIATLHLIITRTELGRAIRAVTADATGALMMGIDVDGTISRTFFIGSGLAALGGIMEGMNFGAVMFNMGFIAAIKGFTAAVIGGLGNVYGALVGGYLLGLMEVFTSAYVPSGSAYKNIITFGVLILCLVFRPNGLLSRP